MYGVSDAGTDITERGKGFWSEASADFAADTKGDSYALIGNAREDRIFSRDELKQLYNTIDDSKTINGYTKSELAGFGEDKMFEILKNKAIEDFRNTDVYINSEGVKVETSFKGTILEEIVDDVIPENLSSCVQIENTEYLKIVNTDKSIISNGIEKSTVYLDDEGNIIGRSFEGTTLEGKIKDTIPKEYTYKTTNEIYSQFADDTTMRNKFGADYDSLTSSEKFKMKEIDYFVRTVEELDDTAKIEKATFINNLQDVYVIYGGNYMGKKFEEIKYTDKDGMVLYLNTWVDNGRGASEPITGEQRRALEFYDDAIAEARKYLSENSEINFNKKDADGQYIEDFNIIVSGHSAAGNLAQFVTTVYKRYKEERYAKTNDKKELYNANNDIDKCVSFDGQVFSSAFLEIYEDEITDRAKKITAYFPTVSYVGALMNDIQGIEKNILMSVLRMLF